MRGPTASCAVRRAARRQYGLLEKKKDYKERADDFHRKEVALRRLRRKAEERNPDEFYFAMEKARTRGGVHTKRHVAAACTGVALAPGQHLASFTGAASDGRRWGAAPPRPTSTRRRSCG